MKKLIYIVILFTLLNSTQAYSQNLGYGDKYVLIKKVMINGIYNPLLCFNLELITGRHSTISVGYSNFSYNFKQDYRELEYDPSMWGGYVPVIPDKGKISQNLFSLEYRQYLNFSITAPQKLFGLANIKLGFANISGNYWECLLTEIGKFKKGKYISYDYENVLATQAEVGAGYQMFLTPSITIDANININLAILNPGGIYNKDVLSTAAKAYGANLIKKGNNVGPDWMVGGQPNTYTLGISAYVQLGFLLF